jgi:hypothetical protein
MAGSTETAGTQARGAVVTEYHVKPRRWRKAGQPFRRVQPHVILQHQREGRRLLGDLFPQQQVAHHHAERAFVVERIGVPRHAQADSIRQRAAEKAGADRRREHRRVQLRANIRQSVRIFRQIDDKGGNGRHAACPVRRRAIMSL